MAEVMQESMKSAVIERYSTAAGQREDLLCCPVDYDPRYLEIIPQEVIERDYGCGDPSKYVNKGETVLDLGSGGGKICFIASQVVGAEGRVIGIDMNDDMLALARNSKAAVAEKAGFDNVTFFKGKIEDLALDRGKLEEYLEKYPIKNGQDLQRFENYTSELRASSPMIKDNSIDVIVSNCVLNLVDEVDKPAMFKELYRVLKKGGRVAISDIISDEEVPVEMKKDPNLWSGCISGAFQEQQFIKMFEDNGFYAITLEKRDEKPWQVVNGIEFRSVTVVAYKGKEGDCWDHKEALVYKGPFKEVTDDDGHTFRRGERTAVCRKTFEIFQQPVYNDFFYGIEPLEAVKPGDALAFPCNAGRLTRSPKETKGEDYSITEMNACGPGDCC